MHFHVSIDVLDDDDALRSFLVGSTGISGSSVGASSSSTGSGVGSTGFFGDSGAGGGAANWYCMSAIMLFETELFTTPAGSFTVRDSRRRLRYSMQTSRVVSSDFLMPSPIFIISFTSLSFPKSVAVN